MPRPVLVSAAGLVLLVTIPHMIEPAEGANDNPTTQETSVGPVAMNGFSIQLHRVDWVDQYKKSIDDIAAFGADSVQLIVPLWQENGAAETVELHPQRTPSAPQLGQLIGHARSRGLRVAVMPVLLLANPADQEWRGNIHPASWDNWFTSYGQALVRIAEVAKEQKADLLYVGAELVSAQKHPAQWEKLIASMRAAFPGTLAYSANWDNYEAVPFWAKVDVVAMNSYWEFKKDTTPAALDEAWKPIRQRVEAFSKRIDRPVLFSEVAYHSVSNAAEEPWDYTRDDLPMDLALQSRLYDAFFRAWDGFDRVAGMMVFEWLPPGGSAGPAQRGYSVQGKPAEQVVRKWFESRAPSR